MAPPPSARLFGRDGVQARKLADAVGNVLGDAFDLSWKLAGVIRGWGGPALLQSYELERRPVGAHNVACSGWAASGVPIWQSLVKPNVLDDTPEAADLRHEIAKSFKINHARMHGMAADRERTRT